MNVGSSSSATWKTPSKKKHSCPTRHRAREPVDEADPPEVEAYANDTARAIIDVREPHEFVGELGHIPGAVNVVREEIPQAALDWQFDKPMLIVCRSGRRSRQGDGRSQWRRHGR